MFQKASKKKPFWNQSIIKNSTQIGVLTKNSKSVQLQGGAIPFEGLQIKNNWKTDIRLKKYQQKATDNVDIWTLSENYNLGLPEDKNNPNVEIKSSEKPNLRQDFFKEMLGFKLKRLNKSGTRTPKELWQRIKYISKGLTLDEWADRVETSWENMLEYTEKLWENYFIYSFKGYKWYPVANKLWSDSWYGQNWKNWRREEDAVTWQTNSRTPWNKHIRLSNDQKNLMQKIESNKNSKGTTYTFPQTVEQIIGANRLKLNNQIFSNTARHELIKQGVYNTEQVENVSLNAWQDSANIYLKYIRTWFMRLNFLDKPLQGVSSLKYLGKEQHRKNYNVIAAKNIFTNEVYKVSYNLKLIKQLSLQGNDKKNLERKYGKRNVKMYLENKSKYKKLEIYEKLLNFRQTNQNLTSPDFVKNAGSITSPKTLNKNVLTIYLLIHY